MITLSDRLKTIADRIEKGETMADIGTDHGFLPLYLYGKGISPMVIMTDVSRHSLEKSVMNANAYDNKVLKNGVHARCGDGLKVLEPGEVDIVVMAGIGGLLMEEILKADTDKSLSFNKYILQPRRHPGQIRHYLMNHGYIITDECLVREGKFICEIITAEPEKTTHEGICVPECDKNTGFQNNDSTMLFCADERMMNSESDSIVWEVPYWYGNLNDSLAEEHIKRKLNREKRILDSKKESEKADTNKTKSNIIYLEKLLAIRKNDQQEQYVRIDSKSDQKE